LDESPNLIAVRALNRQPNTHSQSILILGGSGFLGRHVAALHAAAGDRVVLADRSKPTWELPAQLADHIAWKAFDLATGDSASLLEEASIVYHCAWSTYPASANADPSGDLAANVLPTLRLLEALRLHPGGPRLVFLSSGGTVYGKLQRIPVHEDHPLEPIGAYGAGKAAAEMYCGVYRALYDLDCRVARLSNPFGAGQHPARGQGAVTIFIHRALAGQPIEVWGTGEIVRDYLHVSDAAAGLIAVGSSPPNESQHVFNLGSGQGVSINAIVSELEAVLGRTLEVHYLPGRLFDIPVSILDVTRAREVLGWTARLSFSEGLVRTLFDLERGAHLSTVDHSNVQFVTAALDRGIPQSLGSGK